MDIERLDIWKEFDKLQAEMDAAFDEFFKNTPSREAGVKIDFIPPVNIYRTGNELRIYALIPGAVEEDIDISINGSVLTLRGEAFPVEASDDKSVMVHREWRYGTFERRIELGTGIDSNSISADYFSGVLEIIIKIKK